MITTHPLSSFLKDLKKLSKKYRSLPHEVETLIQELKANPYMGTDLGHGLRKIRLGIASKGKGKRGGARVLTDTEAVVSIEEGRVILLSIYDKSEMEALPDDTIRALVEEARSL